MVTFLELNDHVYGYRLVREPSSLECRVLTALRAGTYPALRDIACEIREGMAILNGQVPSYYQKQLAQEIVRRIEGVDLVVNRVTVE